ncbi:MAG: hypothetical protein RLZZ342_537 [Candidatus Parcubacteria bacterium]
MSHELFEIIRVEPEKAFTDKDRNSIVYLKEKLASATKLGLSSQVSLLSAEISALERGRLLSAPPLSADEQTIWRAWLPTVYTEDGRSGHRFSNYNFDRIPLPVLKTWEQHKQSGSFEAFEIWTPEKKMPDPILVGVNGNARHLLARWGESDANLVSFDDIKHELVQRWHCNEDFSGEDNWDREERFFDSFMFALLPAFLTALASMPFLGLFVPLRLAPLAIGAVCCGALLLFGCLRYRRLTDRLIAASPLMQAIAAHDNNVKK